MTAGLCRDILETDFGGEDGLARVLIISAACLLCLSSCVGIAGFVFLIIFTTDVSAVDLECDQDKFSSMDTFVILCWANFALQLAKGRDIGSLGNDPFSTNEPIGLWRFLGLWADYGLWAMVLWARRCRETTEARQARLRFRLERWLQ